MHPRPLDPLVTATLLALPGMFLLARFAAYGLLCAAGRRPAEDPEQRHRGASVLLGPGLRQGFAWAVRPVERLLAGRRVSPDALTLASLASALGAGALLAFGWVGTGGALALLGSSLDFLDGRIARSTGRASRAGGFLDSTLDRWADLALLAGAAVFFRGWLPALGACLAALAGASLVPYARAKAESLGVALRSGLMQRPERLVVFCAGALLGPLADPFLPEALRGRQAAFAAVIGLLAVLSCWTALHRTVAGYRALAESDRRGGDA